MSFRNIDVEYFQYKHQYNILKETDIDIDIDESIVYQLKYLSIVNNSSPEFFINKLDNEQIIIGVKVTKNVLHNKKYSFPRCFHYIGKITYECFCDTQVKLVCNGKILLEGDNELNIFMNCPLRIDKLPYSDIYLDGIENISYIGYMCLRTNLADFNESLIRINDLTSDEIIVNDNLKLIFDDGVLCKINT